MAHVLAALKIVPKTQASDAAELARELGLGRQAQRYEKPLAENVFTPLTDDEETLWRRHCPTAYFTPPVAANNRSLADYGFDSIPVEVMRHWKAVKDNYTFDSFQIWTTERTAVNTDPLLIGIIGAKLYLLARWGMESPEHLPLKEIARAIYEPIADAAKAKGGSYDFPFQSSSAAFKSRLDAQRRWHDHFAAAERILFA